MTRKHMTMLWVGAGVVGAGALVWLWYQNQKPASLPAVTGNIQNVTLAPGAMTDLTISKGAAISLVAPTGATLGTMSTTPSGILVPASNENYTLVGAAVGTTAVSVSYTDSSGAAQLSTFNVVVTP